MGAIPFIPDSAPFTSEQRAWLNGFLAGLLSQESSPAQAPAASTAEPLLILFGSQSGNAEALAKRIGKEAGAAGFKPRVAGMESVEPAALPQEKNVLVITSTWGEGDMPDNAAAFWTGLNQNGSSPKLTGVRYSVLALGDRNYGDTFCLAGRKFDERLAELGADRVHPRVDCDVEFDAEAKAWSAGVFEGLKNGNGGSATALAPATAKLTEFPSKPVEEAGYSRKNPFPSRLLVNRRLTSEGSAKDTRHIAFHLAGSGLRYEVGDALGVFPMNCPEVVASVMEARGLDPDAAVPVPDGGQAPLHLALARHYEIRSLLGTAPETPADPAAFVAGLRKLQPRLYSIASSLKAHPDEVHLCVGVVKYEKDDVAHKGVASTFLSDRLSLEETAPVFVHTAKHFRPPADTATSMIMVGPGTGIAPFRAFLEERAAVRATGRNWLFFGDQKAATDFLYRDEIESMLGCGVLTRLDTAFSRDQGQKIYVQHRMAENAAELWRWLEEGAHFYVCGDASRMAKDVDAALRDIVMKSGGRTADQAEEYVAEMKETKRYARDVY